ncbi:heparanase-like [Actinia tenebrosa]|uniref:Heparanase-like n=1 Tax=Actinia tenebrosa TaxID=6105 RepID=A0A6P8I140_ACTTE|nr:heparanase-like [Actinia tenebrosa]
MSFKKATLKQSFYLSLLLFPFVFSMPLEEHAFTDSSSKSGNAFAVEIVTTEAFRVVDKRFLSVAIDTHILEIHWKCFNFSSVRLFTLAKGLQPAYLRIGGSGQDFLFYDGEVHKMNGVDHAVQSRECKDEQGRNINGQKKKGINFTINSDDLDNIHEISEKAGWDIVFGLNLLLRSDDGSWNSSNPLEIMRYAAKNGYNFAWELGNEPNNLGQYGTPITAEQDAMAFLTLRQILNDEPELGRMLIGPDVDRIWEQPKAREYLNQFLLLAPDTVDAISWHQYYVNGRTSTAKDFYDVQILDTMLDQLNDFNDIVTVRAPQTKAWIGETSSAWGGGAEGLSDRYIAGFMWLDKLGLSARLNQDVVIRQTFFGGNYALIGTDLLPNPDYWLSLLYKRLVGQEVLKVEQGTERGRLLRVYAHCTNSAGEYPAGAVTVIALNINPKEQATFRLTGDLRGMDVDQYLLTPYGDDLTERRVNLNGKPLKLIDDATLPSLHPVRVSSDLLVLPSLTFSFFVVPNAKAEACKTTLYS